MDVSKAIRELRSEAARLDRMIAELEEFERGATPVPGRRGRHGMGLEEREQVSERMRNYWANRRKTAS